MKNTQDYRPDIDGLRALAVVAVLLSHLRLGIFVGGFIGVDVFFVISGFLITRILKTDPGILNFYKRRILRIFPALFTLLAVTFIVSTLLLFPGEWSVFKQSFIATLFFVSNFYFSKTQGYFGTYSETKPLLHTWSLAVEEQFYIFYPLIFYIVQKYFKASISKIISVLAMIFFIYNLWLINAEHNNLAFYASTARAWELLLGALCALRPNKNFSSRFGNEFLAGAGLIMIFYSVLEYSGATVFPSILPTLGAVFIIYSGKNCKTYIYKLLALKPFVLVGLLSYSLYLWHWPVLVFSKIELGNDLTNTEKLWIVIVSFILATLSWRFVERPFRDPKIIKPLFKTFLYVGIILSFAYLSRKSYQQIIENPVRAIRYASFLDYRVTDSFRMGKCFLCSECNLKEYNQHYCLKPNVNQKNILLMGDSHAAHLWYGFQRTYTDINFMQFTATQCKPLINTEGEKLCVKSRDEIFRKLNKLKPDAIILAARWGNEDSQAVSLTVDYLKKYTKKVFVVGPINEYDISLPKLLVANVINPTDLSLQEKVNLKPYDIELQLKEAVMKTGAIYLSHYQASCPKGPNFCKFVVEDDVPIQFDYGHLTMEGSMWIVGRWRKLNFLEF